jgi:hypothetical protein
VTCPRFPFLLERSLVRSLCLANLQTAQNRKGEIGTHHRKSVSQGTQGALADLIALSRDLAGIKRRTGRDAPGVITRGLAVALIRRHSPSKDGRLSTSYGAPFSGEGEKGVRPSTVHWRGLG